MAQSVKNPVAIQVDLGSIPGWGRSPGEGNGNPRQYSFLGNPMDRGAWQVWKIEEQKEKQRTVGKMEPLDSRCRKRVLSKAHCSGSSEPAPLAATGPSAGGARVRPGPSFTCQPSARHRGSRPLPESSADRRQMAPGEAQEGSAGEPSTGGRLPAAAQRETLAAC